jgi:hypothetical protein
VVAGSAGAGGLQGVRLQGLWLWLQGLWLQ